MASGLARKHAIPPQLDAIANASRSKVPAILIHSEKDTSIPLNLQRLVDKAYQGRKHEILVLGAGHMSPLTPEAEVQFSEDLQWLCARSGRLSLTQPFTEKGPCVEKAQGKALATTRSRPGLAPPCLSASQPNRAAVSRLR